MKSGEYSVEMVFSNPWKLGDPSRPLKEIIMLLNNAQLYTLSTHTNSIAMVTLPYKVLHSAAWPY